MPGEYPPEYRGGGLANWFRKQQGIDGIAKNVPQNSAGGMLSDNLSAIRKWLDKTTISGEIPYTDIGGKMGLGEMFMGQAPELVEDASWGIPPYKKTGHGYQLDPRVADVLGLPLPYAAGGQIAKVLAKKGIEKMIPHKSDLAPESMSRRRFNKNAVGTGLATGAAVGGGLAGKAVVKNIMDAAPIARPAAVAATRLATATTPAAIKMTNMLVTMASNPLVRKSHDDLAKIFKDEGIQGLEDAINESGQKIQFQDFVKGDVDPDEVIKILNRDDHYGSLARDFEPLTPKMENAISDEIDSFVDKIKHASYDEDIEFFDFDKQMADLLDQGYDPDDMYRLIGEKIDIDELPKRVKKMLIDDRFDETDWYIDKLDKINSTGAWEEAVDLTDPAGRLRPLGFRLIER